MNEPRALITGASAGLGAECARQLAAQGKDLILVARRAKVLRELADELNDEYNVKVAILQADLSLPGEPARLYEEVNNNGLIVDFLINNAGSHGPDLLVNRDWDANQHYIELMMTSAAAMCHFFIPDMCERGEGRVMNVASVAGLISFGGDYSYGPTKAYLVALSRSSLALSVGSKGVKVMALCPGFTHNRVSPGWQGEGNQAEYAGLSLV